MLQFFALGVEHMEITNLSKKVDHSSKISLVGIMVSITFSLYRAIYVNPNNLNVIYTNSC